MLHSTGIPFCSKPQPCVSVRLDLVYSQGCLWPCGSRTCQICHPMSPWRCHLKAKKACFTKQQIKIALPIQHIHSLCVLKIQLLTAITGMRTCVLWDQRGWAGVQLCHQPSHVELVVPSAQTPWQQQGQSIGAEGHV